VPTQPIYEQTVNTGLTCGNGAKLQVRTMARALTIHERKLTVRRVFGETLEVSVEGSAHVVTHVVSAAFNPITVNR
jgi:hypothetical protein